MSASLPDKLNTFYACFKNNFTVEELQKAIDLCPLVISGQMASLTNSQDVGISTGSCLNWHFQFVTAKVCILLSLSLKRPKSSAWMTTAQWH